MNAPFDNDLSNVRLASTTMSHWTTRRRSAPAAWLCSVLEASHSGYSQWLVVDTMAGRVHVRCDDTTAPPVFSAPGQLLLLG